MHELFKNYYQEIFSSNKSQQCDIKTFNLVCRKIAWNYDRFFKSMSRDAKILDLGCGIGQCLYYLDRQGFKNIKGIDISPSQIEAAGKMLLGINIELVEDSIKYLEDNAEKFDVIVMNDVLEHIPPDQLIPITRAMYAALKKRGTVIVKTINSAYPLGSFLRYIDLTHTTAFHEKSLTHLLAHAGFKNIKCYQEEIGIYNILFLCKKMAVILVRFLLKCLIYFSEADWPNIISLNVIAAGRK
ncbi:SAM-dependent methyltransferase [Desulfonema limicola]|uniref:SAM-dependent methyltransferase n=1 Tax=Desulfonema limicola TaxID=45656 RepID=A0A975GI24_9BACT|nr:class I SAM-dependent methyltransferase [Desulfonema limicola]QTA81899.1 SAM-dependent methyltransferase [Desulfonema limicola]